jgi:transposase
MMATLTRGCTMPRPIPVPVRRTVIRLWEQGRTPAQIAEALGVPRPTVHRLIRRFRRRGAAGLAPDYRRAPDREGAPSDLMNAVWRARREHPTWGAPLIRLHLLEQAWAEPVPSARTLQRWLLRGDLAPAPAGRRARSDYRRAAAPHQTWQMDAKELVDLQNHDLVSWLRLIDECSGAALGTAVFPPRPVEPGPSLGRPGSAPPGVHPLGPARGVPGRQRLPLGVEGGLAVGAGDVADRPGGRDDLEHAATPPGERRGRTVAGDGRPLVRAPDLRVACGIAGPPGTDGPAPPRGLSLPRPQEPVRVLPGPDPFGPAIFAGVRVRRLGLGPRHRAPVGLRRVPAGEPDRDGLDLQPRVLRREGFSRPGRVRHVRPGNQRVGVLRLVGQRTPSQGRQGAQPRARHGVGCHRPATTNA